MFSDATKLVGAISYDGSKTNGLYANPTTGYFKNHADDSTPEPLVVIGNNGNATLLCGDIDDYTIGTAYTDNLGSTTVNDVFQLSADLSTGSGKLNKGSFDYNEFITSANFDESIKDYHPTNLESMFANCIKLKTITNAGRLNMSNVTSIHAMFFDCRALESVDVSGWDISSVTDMSNMFFRCTSLQTLSVAGWNTEKVTNMVGMFSDCSNLESLNVTNWVMSSVADMQSAFANCKALKTLDVSKWNVQNVEHLNSLFANCESLEVIDVSKWQVKKATWINSMFYKCASVKTLDCSGWDTSNVTAASSAFSGCTSLTSVKVNTWDTSKIQSMTAMFSFCEALEILDLSNWNVSSVTEIVNMFMQCKKLKTIYAGNWTSQMKAPTDSVIQSSGVREGSACMFEGCKVLQGVISYDYNKINGSVANSTNGYFTAPKALTLQP